MAYVVVVAMSGWECAGHEVRRSYPYYLSLSMTPGDKPPSETNAMTDEERALLEEVKK